MITLTAVAQLAVALATALLVPFGLRLAGASRPMVVAAFVAGALAAGSQLVAPGTLAVVLVVPWLLVGAWAFVAGAGRMLRRLWFPISELGLGFAMTGVLAAGIRLVAHHAGFAILGYPPDWVMLTAAHFHVAGVLLPLVAGLLARESRAAGVAVAGAVLSVPMTAVGIHMSRGLEVAGGLTVVASGLILAAVQLGRARRVRGAARWLHVASALALLVSMGLAASYALRGFAAGFSLLGLDVLTTMAVSHGALNVVVFAGGALAALALAPVPAGPAAGIPMSRWSNGRFRPGEEIQAGLVDRLDELAHPGFDAARVAPEVRRFYEQTSAHVMRVRPSWQPGFRLGGRLWARLARGLQQLQLPTRDEATPVDSRLHAVDAEQDGRPGARAWLRRYPDGRALYKAVYATHRRNGAGYMNIAFPLPASHLASILRMDDLPGGAIVVSTRAGDDAGIWWVLTPGGRRWPLRLPMNETVRVWPRAAAPAELVSWGGQAEVLASHELWLFGVKFLTLDYAVSVRG